MFEPERMKSLKVKRLRLRTVESSMDRLCHDTSWILQAGSSFRYWTQVRALLQANADSTDLEVKLVHDLLNEESSKQGKGTKYKRMSFISSVP